MVPCTTNILPKLSRLTITDNKDFEHRRGWHIAGTLLLDDNKVLSYVQSGDGSEPVITYSEGAQSIMTNFFYDVDFGNAMKTDRWSRTKKVELSYMVSTAFECKYDEIFP
jgi:hypothetical protein